MPESLEAGISRFLSSWVANVARRPWAVVLAMLAVPLSHMAPRQGRYGKVGYALIVYIIYFNLMVYTRAELKSDSLPIEINFWWVHLLFIALTLGLLIRRNGGYRFAMRTIGR